MDKVNRNDPCPCGSGKKYKQCCGDSKVVGLDTAVIASEIRNWQSNFIHYGYEHYIEDIEEYLEDEFDVFDEDDEFMEIAIFLSTIWYIFYIPDDSGETIYDEFLFEFNKELSRPRTKSIVESWTTEKIVSLFTIESMEGTTAQIKDIFNDNTTYIVRFDSDDTPESIDTLLYGILLPFGNVYEFFPSHFSFSSEHMKLLVDSIYKVWDEFDEFDTIHELIEYEFPAILTNMMSTLVMSMIPDVNIQDFEWATREEEDVAALFQVKMKADNYTPDVIGTGLSIWEKFCSSYRPTFRKPELFAAALEFVVRDSLFDDLITKKEVAEKYQISPASLTNKVRLLTDELYNQRDSSNTNSSMAIEQELTHLKKQLEAKNFDSFKEVEDFVENALKPSGNKQVKQSRSSKKEAQALVVDAMKETNPLKRHQLAKKALKLNPNCPDAYYLLAESTTGINEKLSLLADGVKVGERELGSSFINQNKGHFWGLTETRPYMRVKYEYAEQLFRNNKINEAIQHFKELLELNPMDNQGVRYSLLTALIHLERVNEAKQLMEETLRDDATAYSLFNKVLVYYLQNGKVNDKQLKAAINANRYVPAYLLGKKAIPDEEVEFIGMGDDAEAIHYAQQHFHIWKKYESLLELLKSV